MDPSNDFATFVSQIETSIPGGTVPIISVVVCGLVAMWRREWFQSLLPVAWQWDNWTRMRKWAVSFSTGLACGALTNLAAGKSWPVAIALGAGAGLGAMGLRETVKAGQSTLPPSVSRDAPTFLGRMPPSE